LGFDVWDGFFGGPFFIFIFAEVLGLGLDWRARFVFFVIFFVIFAAPRIFGERGLVYRARINDYAGFDDGLEIGWVRFEGLKSLSSKELRGQYWKQTGCGRR
jgi:hypothetical protein